MHVHTHVQSCTSLTLQHTHKWKSALRNMSGQLPAASPSICDKEQKGYYLSWKLSWHERALCRETLQAVLTGDNDWAVGSGLCGDKELGWWLRAPVHTWEHCVGHTHSPKTWTWDFHYCVLLPVLQQPQLYPHCQSHVPQARSIHQALVGQDGASNS